MTKGRYQVTNTTPKQQMDSGAGITAHTYQWIAQLQLISGRTCWLVNSGGKKTAGRYPASNSATGRVQAGPTLSRRAAPWDTQGKSRAQVKQNNLCTQREQEHDALPDTSDLWMGPSIPRHRALQQEKKEKSYFARQTQKVSGPNWRTHKYCWVLHPQQSHRGTRAAGEQQPL